MSRKILVDPEAVKRMVDREGIELGTALIFAATPVPDEIESLRRQLAASQDQLIEATKSAIRTALRNLGNADIGEIEIEDFANQYGQRLHDQTKQSRATIWDYPSTPNMKEGYPDER